MHFHALPLHTGLHTLTSPTCDLLQFHFLKLQQGEEHTLSTQSREFLLVMLCGTAHVQVNEHTFKEIGNRPDVFSGLPHSVYLPCQHTVTITAHTDIEVALPSAPSDLDTPPYEIRPEQVRTGTWGRLNFTRHYREILVEPNGMPACKLIAGETVTPSGNWSTFPAHKHEINLGNEVHHEEIYYFRNSSPDGWGVVRHYSPERHHDDLHVVKDHTLLEMPHGYHTYVAAPGSQSYYLWFLAGDGRKQGATLEPTAEWITRHTGDL